MGTVHLGVIVGRFQVPELTEGHKKLINHVRSQHGQVVVAIGCIVNKERTRRDPLDYYTREAMIKAEAPDAIVIPLPDVPGNDAAWSQGLDDILKTICPIGEIVLYGGRDSFIPYYSGKFNVCRVELEFSPSGTDLREYAANRIRISSDFRAGMIYSMMNMFGRVYPTVDIAIVRGDVVLMGRKPNESLWRFPGGHVDVTDETLEIAAAREAKEETGISVNPCDLSYVGSIRTGDQRYSPEKDRAAITTSLFAVEELDQKAKPGDDLSEVRWISFCDSAAIGNVMPTHINPVHISLFYMLMKWHGKRPKGDKSV